MNSILKNVNYKSKEINVSFFKKIFVFSFIQSINSIPLILLFIFSVFSQLIVGMSIYLSNNNLLDYTLLILFIPLIILSIFVFLLVNIIFNENKYNGIEQVLNSKPISRIGIFLAKFNFVTVSIFITIILQTIISLIFFGVVSFNLMIPIFISNIFISSWILILFSLISIIAAIIFNPIWFSLSSLTVIIVMFGLSLFTRVMIENNDLKITYNNKEVSFSKVVFKNSSESYIVSDVKNAEYYNIEYDKYLGNQNIFNGFVPSEWFASYYGSLFTDFNITNSELLNYDYSINKIKFKNINTNLIDLDNNKEIFIFNPEDVVPFDLSNLEYENLLINELKDIKKSEPLMSDQLFLKNFIIKITNNVVWNEQTLTLNEINFLKKLLSIDLKHNQLFYYYKYYSDLKLKTSNILERITSEINIELSNLLNFLWNSNNTNINIFNEDNVLGTMKPITDFFPSVGTLIQTKPLTESDILFFKNDLIRFSNSIPQYLSNDGTYKSLSDLLAILTRYNASIVDMNTWRNFIDTISVQVSEVELLNTYLQTNITDIYDFKPENNFNNLYKYSNFLQIDSEPYIKNSSVAITMTSILTVYLLFWAIHLSKTKQYNQ